MNTVKGSLESLVGPGYGAVGLPRPPALALVHGRG